MTNHPQPYDAVLGNGKLPVQAVLKKKLIAASDIEASKYWTYKMSRLEEHYLDYVEAHIEQRTLVRLYKELYSAETLSELLLPNTLIPPYTWLFGDNGEPLSKWKREIAKLHKSVIWQVYEQYR